MALFKWNAWPTSMESVQLELPGLILTATPTNPLCPRGAPCLRREPTVRVLFWKLVTGGRC
ncbi:hypothetical protein DFAR_3850011 [Desulfarculales bacterium]